MAPRITVIVATYNRSEVLRWAVRCVLAQTFRDWELIVVGDACTDDTPALMATFGDPRVRFVNLPENHGEQSGPNNHGFELSQGELIAYLNHDDLWFPDHLETLVARLEQERADLAYALPISIDASGLVFCGTVNSELLYDPSHFVPASLWLARRELIAETRGWRPSRRIYAKNPSQDLLFRAWKQGRKIHCSPRVTTLILPSANVPGSYVRRDDAQHSELFQGLSDPALRERLMTRAVIAYAQMLSGGGGNKTWFRKRFFRSWFDRAMVALRQHPDTVRNRLAGRRPGFWIEHLRQLRGLPPRSGSGTHE